MSVCRNARTAGAISAATLALVLGGAGTALAVSLPDPTPTVSAVASTATTTVTAAASLLTSSGTASSSPSPTPSPSPVPQPSSLLGQVTGTVGKVVAKATSVTKTPAPTTKSPGQSAAGKHQAFVVQQPGHSIRTTSRHTATGTGAALAFSAATLPYLGNLDIAGLPPVGLAPQLASGQWPALATAQSPTRVRLASGHSPVPGGLPMLLVVVAVATVGAAAAAHVGVIQQRIMTSGTHAA